MRRHAVGVDCRPASDSTDWLQYEGASAQTFHRWGAGLGPPLRPTSLPAVGPRGLLSGWTAWSFWRQGITQAGHGRVTAGAGMFPHRGEAGRADPGARSPTPSQCQTLSENEVMGLQSPGAPPHVGLCRVGDRTPACLRSFQELGVFDLLSIPPRSESS